MARFATKDLIQKQWQILTKPKLRVAGMEDVIISSIPENSRKLRGQLFTYTNCDVKTISSKEIEQDRYSAFRRPFDDWVFDSYYRK